jgi:4-amino-4-deoxy-L-arabinose transferase
MWAAFGLAFLTKGPPALLPLLGILIFTAWTDGAAGLRALWSWVGVAAFLAIGGSWFAVVITQRPQLADYFLHREIAARIVTGGFGRNEEWYGSILVYGPALLLGTMPWTWVVLRRAAALARGVADRSRASERLLVVLLATSILVLALARSRLPLYVLPLFVPLALVVGSAPVAAPRRRLLLGLGIWLAVLTAAKAISATVPSVRDGRMLAQSLRAQLPFPVRDVAFVETSPHYGLGLYLDCESKEVVLGGDPGARDAYPRPFQALLAEAGAVGPDKVFVVPAIFAQRFVELASTGGVSMQRIGGVLLGGHLDLGFYRGDRTR